MVVTLFLLKSPMSMPYMLAKDLLRQEMEDVGGINAVRFSDEIPKTVC